MPRRSGATLIEVLVAIFVMAIGMLALLTLFPLGALRMAKAIQDERCFQAGNSAASLAVMKSIAQDPDLLYPRPPNPTNPPQRADAFLNPGPLSVVPVPNAHANFPSYPVFVDPIGVRAVGGGPGPPLCNGLSAIVRRSVSFVTFPPPPQTSAQAAYQWFTLQDDIDFENAPPNTNSSQPGTPRLLLPVAMPANGTFSRSPNYSWAFLIQRPRYSEASVVDAAVVVYNQRSVTPVNLALPETAFSATFNPGNNIIIINYGANVPASLRVGDWVLDATPYNFMAPNNQGQPTQFGSAHGYFYRTVSVNDLGGGLMELEVEQPIRGFPLPPINPQGTPPQFPGTLLVLDGVAEVYVKGVSR